MANGDIIFDHEKRKMIFNHILTYPGVSFHVLKNIFSITSGTLRYHLEYLEKAKRILANVEKGKRCYYPLKDDIEVSKLFENRPRAYSLNDTQQKLLNLIKRNPEITQKRLIQKTGLSRFTVSYNMRKFIDLGLIKKSNNAKNVCYEYMTDELLKHEVLLRLTMKLLDKEIDERAFIKLRKKLIGN